MLGTAFTIKTNDPETKYKFTVLNYSRLVLAVKNKKDYSQPFYLSQIKEKLLTSRSQSCNKPMLR